MCGSTGVWIEGSRNRMRGIKKNSSEWQGNRCVDTRVVLLKQICVCVCVRIVCEEKNGDWLVVWIFLGGTCEPYLGLRFEVRLRLPAGLAWMDWRFFYGQPFFSRSFSCVYEMCDFFSYSPFPFQSLRVVVFLGLLKVGCPLVSCSYWFKPWVKMSYRRLAKLLGSFKKSPFTNNFFWPPALANYTYFFSYLYYY